MDNLGPWLDDLDLAIVNIENSKCPPKTSKSLRIIRRGLATLNGVLEEEILEF